MVISNISNEVDEMSRVALRDIKWGTDQSKKPCQLALAGLSCLRKC